MGRGHKESYDIEDNLMNIMVSNGKEGSEIIHYQRDKKRPDMSDELKGKDKP